jgi:hypothetical protein
MSRLGESAEGHYHSPESAPRSIGKASNVSDAYCWFCVSVDVDCFGGVTELTQNPKTGTAEG